MRVHYHIIMAVIGWATTASFGANIFVDGLLPSDCVAGEYSAVRRDNSGADGNAYNTPQKAADAARPGDTVYFREGVYYNHADLRDYAVVMNISVSGEDGNPITFCGYPGERATLSAARPDNVGHFYSVTLGTAPSLSLDVSGQGVRNIVIDGLYVEGCLSGGANHIWTC